MTRPFTLALVVTAVAVLDAGPARAQHDPGAMMDPAAAPMDHDMWSADLGGGWHLLGMAQLFPIVTVGAPGEGGSPLNDTEFYLTQPALMANLESPGQRLVLRTTLNFEGLTQEDGELTFGGWGEGFIDKRHPHTLLHEAMLSLNFWDVAGGALSVSGGKGFAPYGTDDPMARPGLKYPTNHHLSQILERWTLNGVYLRDGWSLEAGVFGGAEPEDPYDLGNIESFGDSWSARIAKRWGNGSGPMAEWEASASYGDVAEEHEGETERTALWNAALRHARPLGSGAGEIYALLEASMSEPEHEDGYFSVLGETRLALGRHQPYLRLEYASRPEYPREGAPGTDGFFRYDHHADAIGATRWLIGTLAYAYELTGYPLSIRPFAEAQVHRVDTDRGGIDPETLFGTDSFWSLSVGARIFLGGDPMRMGAYGVLDPMTTMSRMMPAGHGMEMHAQAPSGGAQEAQIRAVVRDFHAALAAGDSLRALQHLHPEVVVYEAGHAETLAEYRSGHLRSDIAFASAVEREITGDAVTLWDDAALYTAETHTTGQWRDREVDSRGAESIVLVRTGQGWRIRHIHWSSR